MYLQTVDRLSIQQITIELSLETLSFSDEGVYLPGEDPSIWRLFFVYNRTP
jgi:hypothetical protein